MAAQHGGAWSYAVPLEETDGNARPLMQHVEQTSDKDPRHLQKRSSAWDLMSDSETTKQRRTSLRASNVAQQAAKKRSRNQLRDKRPEEKKEGRVDDSAWIHRDKLAQIEIQEMQEAGIYVRKSRRSESAGPVHEDDRTRSVSRSGARRASSRTNQERQGDIIHPDEDHTHSAAFAAQMESPRKRVSTVPSANEEEPALALEHEPEPSTQPELTRPPLPDYDPYLDSSFRAHSGSGGDHQQLSKQQMSRPGTSRIPVSRISPVPVPQTVVDRDSPLPRSRAGSQNWSGSFDEMQYARKARSGSVSSQVLLDSEGDTTRRTPPGSSNKTSSNDENSPPKARVPKKTVPNGRKPSASSAATPRPGSSHQQNKRAPSTSAARRPGSSSGHKSRPSSVHMAPEGEAPWIATMYKPDPRLPPDQQMLPTHAKRMMQEQWEKDGKTGTIYDRDFRLLNDEEPRPPKLHAPALTLDSKGLEPPQRSPSPTKRDKTSPNATSPNHFPTSPARSDARSDSNGRPGTSGGYKITPTIAQTPTMQRSPVHSPPPPAPMPVQNPTPRVPELDEKQEAAPKKGCCCVMM